MKIFRPGIAIIKGILCALTLIGVWYFVSAYGDIMWDTVIHIPQELFEGYRPKTLDGGFTAKFFAWLVTEFCLFMIMPYYDPDFGELDED